MSLNDDAKFEIEYDYTAEEVKTALTAFQKDKSGKKNLIYTALLVLVAINFLYSAIGNISESYFSLFLVGLCIALIFIINYNPRRYIKNMVDAVKSNENENVKFNISFYDEFFTTSAGNFQQDEENFVDKYMYYDQNILIYEIDNVFLVAIGSEKIYVLPKRCLGEKEQELKDFLKINLQENYKFLA